MKPALILLLALLTQSTSGQYFHVVSHKEYAEVFNKAFGYKFNAPKRWHICVVSPNPIAISYPPAQLRFASIGLPKGGAEIYVIADEALGHAGSVDAWVRRDTNEYGFAEKKDIAKPINPDFVHAVRVTRFDDVGDDYTEEVLHWITIYTEFNGHILAVQLRYHANDPNARLYEGMFDDTLRSFKKIS